MPFTALLDSCVLYPPALRDTLLRIAEVGLYRPLWSTQIFEEVRRNLPVDPTRIERMLRQMNDSFDDALVTGYESLTHAMINHPKDRHVLAAAVVGRADAIVTFIT